MKQSRHNEQNVENAKEPHPNYIDKPGDPMTTEDIHRIETIPLEGKTFQFACIPEEPCFTCCCHGADLRLYPSSSA